MRSASRLVALFVALSIAALTSSPAAATSLTVNSTEDGTDFAPGDGICETAPGNGQCTLRAAMVESNALPGHDTISFDIPPGSDPGCDSGSGICSIATDNELPDVGDVTIDGYTQPGATPNTNGPDQGSNAQPKIEVRALTEGGLSVALDVGSDSIVRGLWLNRATTSVSGNNSNTIAGNFFLAVDGETASMENATAILIMGTGNVIGGTNAADRNVIAYPDWKGVALDGPGNFVQGNLIGVDAGGTARIGSRDFGVVACAPNNIIGGTTANARNVISGTNTYGVLAGGPLCSSNDPTPDGMIIQGNYIGVDVSGNPLGNVSFRQLGMGIDVRGNSVIGGTGPGEANIIANNKSDGVTVLAYSGHPPAIVTMRGNLIYNNEKLGFDDNVGLTAPPEITSVTLTPSATVAGTSCTGCIIDIYSDDQNEGRIYHGSTTALGNGDWLFSTETLDGPTVTATATSPAGSTSQFAVYAIDGSADEDADGFSHDLELYLGTNPINGCADTMTADDEDPDPYPPDFNDNQTVTISDVLAMKPVFNGISIRHDLVPSGGLITISDVLALKQRLSLACLGGAQ